MEQNLEGLLDESGGADTLYGIDLAIYPPTTPTTSRFPNYGPTTLHGNSMDLDRATNLSNLSDLMLVDSEPRA